MSGLQCFTSLFEEVQQETSPQYWKYVAQKVKAFEQAWAGFNLQETKQ
jgi:3-methyladenine DNA glycosylase Tag